MLKSMTVRATIAAILAGLSMSAYAIADSPKRVDIPAGELRQALLQASEQFGTDLVYSPEQIRGIQTRGAHGQLTTEQAVSKLLEGTPLELRTDPSGAMLITLPANSSSLSTKGRGTEEAPTSTGEEKKSIWSRLRLAQSETPSPSQGKGRGEDRDESSSKEENSSAKGTAEKIRGVPEILVRGKKTLNMNVDIPRTENDPQPYVVIGSDEIHASAAANVEELFAGRLPMNATLGSQAQAPTSSRGAGSDFNLRGLGNNQTLLLVDGQRLPIVNGGSTFIPPDLNAIPLGLIERIEVLPSTASGIYGGGATGGVINVITAKSLEGGQLNASFGGSFRGDADQHRLDGAWGGRLPTGGTFAAGFSYSKFDGLRVGDRDLAERARGRQLAANPAAFFGATAPPAGVTANIRSTNGSSLVLDTGRALGSPITFVPMGYGGAASDSGAALVANAGTYNLDIPNSALGTEADALSAYETDSFLFGARQPLGERLELFTDLSWYQNVSRGYGSDGRPTTVSLPADAPTNPFTTAVTVQLPAVGLLDEQKTRIAAIRATLGWIYRLGGDWLVSGDAAWGRSSYRYYRTTPALGDPDGTGPGIAFATAISTGIFDPLRDVNTFAPDWAPYRLPLRNQVYGPAIATLTLGTLRASGPVLTLPGGDAGLTAALEWRRDEVEDVYFDNLSVDAVPSVSLFPNKAQETRSAYVEFHAPVFGSANARPWVRELDLQASVRYENVGTESVNPGNVAAASRDSPFPPYAQVDNTVGATSFTLGLRYAPFQGVTLRASYGTGFLAPDVSQIASSERTVSGVALSDPRRGGATTVVPPFLILEGGSDALQPEKSHSWSAGAVIEPQFAPGLRLSADYTRIRKTSEIYLPLINDVLSFEDILPGRVTRAPLTDADRAAGYTGGIVTSVDTRQLNIGTTELSAVDVQADYRWTIGDWGQFGASAVATYNPQFERRFTPTQSATDYVGFQNILKWRGNLGLSWSRGPWQAAWNTQFYDSYHQYTPTTTAAAIAASILNQGASRIPAQAYSDASIAINLAAVGDGSVVRGTELRVAVQNIFDRKPPVMSTTAGTQGYSRYGDPRLRRFTVSLSKHF
ncbi:MAG: TonB-dependent receptor [Gammaproteobacteria bacterium]